MHLTCCGSMGRIFAIFQLKSEKRNSKVCSRNPPERSGILRRWERTPKKLLDQARRFGLEGLIGKRAGSHYETGRRTGSWIKLKLLQRAGIRHWRIHATSRLPAIILAHSWSAFTKAINSSFPGKSEQALMRKSSAPFRDVQEDVPRKIARLWISRKSGPGVTARA